MRVVAQEPYNHRSHQYHSANLAQILLATLPHMPQSSLQRRHSVGRKLHHKWGLVLSKEETPENTRRKERHQAAEKVQPKEHQTSITREESTRQKDIHGKSCTTRDKGVYQYGNQPTTATLNGTRSHNGWHIATKAHNKRNERLAVQTRKVHHLIHNKRRTRHITRVLHQRNEQIEYKDIGQKDRHRADTADDAIHNQILQCALAHHRSDHIAQPAEASLNPLLRICAKSEGTPEHHEHQEQEQRNT